MAQKTLLHFIFLLAFVSAESQEAVLKKGMHINKSIKFKKGAYTLPVDDGLFSAAIIIEGNDVVVDFNNALFIGNDAKQFPDEYRGIAVKINGGRNITIKNLKVRGYKIAVFGKNIESLKIENCDFSYNYRQHLNSTQERENFSDWMSYHHNENDEWLRYGAAMYLRNCNNALINNVRVSNGQNGLMMVECNNGIIYNNDFSFNSGIGLGMYKSNNNKVIYNKLDFNIRGYSDGVYSRGQDSAGILLFEQSSNNLFYKNSATHGGDGFFLWAGASTMNNGVGGCNDNILKDNDFSDAAAIGIEVTFSRNRIIHNRIFDCDYGIWAGYSYGTRIAQNQFRFNKTAIAVEHGQYNIIDHNLFYEDGVAIKLWAGREDSTGWGYPIFRDTKSHNYIIEGNSYNKDSLTYFLSNTDSLKIFNNREMGCLYALKKDSGVINVDTSADIETDFKLSEDVFVDIPVVENPNDPFKGSGKLRGRKAILMSEWGPYNYEYPLIWNEHPTNNSLYMEFSVLGTLGGRWKVLRTKGLDSVQTDMRGYPGKIRGKRSIAFSEIEIIAEYTGPGFTDPFGRRIGPQKKYVFRYLKSVVPIHFFVRWFALGDKEEVWKGKSVSVFENTVPFRIENVSDIYYAWWGPVEAEGKKIDRFLTISEGYTDLTEGLFELSVTWNGAIKVFIDDKLVIEDSGEFTGQNSDSKNKRIRLKLSGSHKFRMEHLKDKGFSALSLQLNKVN